MKLRSYFLVDRKNQSPTEFESNVDEVQDWLLGTTILGKWGLTIKKDNGDVTYEDQDLPLNIHIDDLDTYNGYVLHRSVGSNVLNFDFTCAPVLGTRVDVSIEFVE